MKHLASLFVALATLTLWMSYGCSDKKNNASQDDSLDARIDFVPVDTDTVPVDTMEAIIAETPMPKAADELFDDFLFNFTANKKLQFERVKFPLPVTKGKQTTQLTQQQWKMEKLFMKEGFYTLILDNEKQLSLSKDTTVNHVVVEKVQLDTKTVEQFIFNRENGLWLLTEINHDAMAQNNNASFLDFYARFASDSIFQVHSLSEPVKTTVPDPDDDFKMIDGEFYPEQWQDFQPPVLPKGFIYTIIYGQEYKQSKQKIFIIRGISNGLETEMTFQIKDGKWKLVKLLQ